MNIKDQVWTVPNIMSLFRLLLLAPILICLSHEAIVWVFFFILLSITTDLLDGYIARHLNQCSDFGRIIDPLVDKINVVVITGFLVISHLYEFPLWFFIFILIRETIIVLGGLIMIRKKSVVVESNWAGKKSAFLTGIAILFFILQLQPYAWILLYSAVGLTLYSSTIYILNFIRQEES
jgi:CDP-diacylglycerol--glycerol-3-phosphate 3-phosphatidyltransferase